ncbi:uncharacterized protein LOC120444828 [Drosophila santomea]|uniref:uncharacterized protein LOC120444828 n=1 Tax=Drosophila santomea TaxID=129105 RepID=UPI001953EB29|nr:uncharacterized protein LOC120444828 [Drosophila santomea]
MQSIHLVLFGSYLFWSVLSEPIIVYKLKNIECSTVPGFSANASCHIRAVNWNKAVAEMDVYLLRTLYNITILKRDYTNQFQPFLVDVQINMCDALSRRSFIPYGLIILRISRMFSNFNHSCPYYGHLLARDAYLNETFFPNVFPLGFYKLNITIMENYRTPPSAHVGGFVWYVQVMQAIQPKKKKPNRDV